MPVLILKILVVIVLVFILIHHNHPRIEIIEGKGKGQVRFITSYNPETKTIKLHKPFDIMPDATSKFKTWR